VLVATHQLKAALATLVLFKRKVSPSADTKPGKAPKVCVFLYVCVCVHVSVDSYWSSIDINTMVTSLSIAVTVAHHVYQLRNT